jgi:hypothetical protein
LVAVAWPGGLSNRLRSLEHVEVFGGIISAWWVNEADRPGRAMRL